MSRFLACRRAALICGAWLTLLSLSWPVAAQQKTLTLDDLYHPDRETRLVPPSRGLPTWISDTHFVIASPRAPLPAGTIEKVDAATGKGEPWLDASKLADALGKLPGVSADEAKRLARLRLGSFNPQRTVATLTIGDDLYAYDFSADRLVRLSHGAGVEETPVFSPDGRLVAYIRDYDLFVSDTATGQERELTTGGTAALLNGKLDWVYQEEVYGRGVFQAFWWSPDSTRLAYLQLNEAPVPEYTVVDDIPYRATLETYDYPKAGDPNPTVKLGVVRATGGDTRWVNTDGYSGADHLIVHVAWAPDSSRVIYQVQNREQTWLDLNAASADSGEPARLIRESSKTWVDVHDAPEWLKDGTFLWFSERGGFKHLYHYKPDGTLIRQVTNGRWEARSLHGVDEAGGWIYFSGTERSPIGSDLYRVKLDGSSLTRLTQTPGTHSVRFNPSFSLFLDEWSDINTPPQSRVYKADGSDVRLLDDGKLPALAGYRLGKFELLQVKARDGFVMEAMMLKPPDFDPSRKYPVFQTTYAGPHAQTVRDAWGGAGALYYQLLAQKGIIVWACDNRTASGKGAESTWPIYRNAGESELRDIEDCLAWLKKQPGVDGARVGINGWSYGGFMVSYALTHSKSFAMGIAGGSVTDWRDYDSIYTERFMALPQNNPDGYKKASPRFAAKDLSGRLLLIHGAIDDNVHVQNTLQFAYELQKANKPFELMLYPKSRHGVSDPWLVYHMRGLMLDFTLRTLTPSGASNGAQTAQ